jgi:long-chain acyl-CoA synthetase
VKNVNISDILPVTPIRAAFSEMERMGSERVVLLDAGTRNLTYSMVRQEVEMRALSFFTQGVRPGDIIALVNDNPFEFVLHLLAIAFLNARAVLIDSATIPTVRQQLMQMSTARFLLSAADGLVLLEQQKNSALAQQAQDEYHYLLIPTSASTGQPKLVIRTQDAMLAEGRAYARSLPIHATDRLLVMLPLHHAFGVGLCIFSFLVSGCSLVILDQFTPRAALYAVEDRQVTLLPGVPYMFNLMVRTPLKRSVHLDHIRLCLAGAGPLDEKDFLLFRERFGHAIHSTFGSTETGAATWVPDDDFAFRRVGQPLWNVRLEIRSPEIDNSADEIGQLFLQTPALMRGYLTEQGLDAAQIKDDWFSTGDLARRGRSGDIYLVGRTTHIINIAGKKVNPLDVETVLAGHPSVEDVAVIGIEDEERITRLAALVVASQDVDAQLLIAYCTKRLHSYQVPRFIAFTSSLHRNEAGKIMRDSLYHIWNQGNHQI